MRSSVDSAAPNIALDEAILMNSFLETLGIIASPRKVGFQSLDNRQAIAFSRTVQTESTTAGWTFPKKIYYIHLLHSSRISSDGSTASARWAGLAEAAIP